MSSEDATKRLSSKKQTLDDAYAAPANFLEIDVINPITHGIGNKKYTDSEVRMKVNNFLSKILQITFHTSEIIFERKTNVMFGHGSLETPVIHGSGIPAMTPSPFCYWFLSIFDLINKPCMYTGVPFGYRIMQRGS